MRIAVVTHFFPPEACAAATRVESLVAALGRAGHDVTVVTNFPSFHADGFAAGDRFAMRRIERSNGVTAVRLGSILAKKIPGGRLVHWGTSALAATILLLTARSRFDTIIVSMPPITLAIPALIGAARHRSHLVVDVRDVFPDLAVQMGEWRRDGIFARGTEWLARRLYRRADLVVAVTPTAIEQIAARGVERSRLVLARNAAEIASLTETVPAMHEGFTAIYAGNLGLATDADVLLDAAALLRDDGIAFEIVGGGARSARVTERIRDERLTNVSFRGSVPRPEALRLIAGSDVMVVPLRTGIKESIPTKLYDALSVGCLPVVVAGGEAYAEGRELGARCVPAGDAQALARELRALRDLGRPAVRALGESGQRKLQERANRAGIMEGLAVRISALG